MVKICGVTRLADAIDALELGADALGFNFALGPRKIAPEAAAGMIREARKVKADFMAFGVFANAPAGRIEEDGAASGIDVIQFHGGESPQFVNSLETGLKKVKAVRVKDELSIETLGSYHCFAYLLDAFVKGMRGGTGATFNWDIAKKAAAYGKIILAGGLTPDNVEKAVGEASPWMVDTASGVESSPGVKDKAKMKAFIGAAKKL